MGSLSTIIKRITIIWIVFIIFLCAIGCGKSSTVENEKVTTESETESQEIVYDKYKIGDVVTFGSYEQDNDWNNGKEPIEWIILDKNNDGYILISKYVLDCKVYQDSVILNDVTWETSTLRQWLNNDFYHTAFSNTEQSMIVTTLLSNPDNEQYGTEGGNDTYDNVFVLSSSELKQYFPEESGRTTTPTVYAEYKGVWCPNGSCYWMLRSPGNYSTHVKYIDMFGREMSIASNSMDVVRPSILVRADIDFDSYTENINQVIDETMSEEIVASHNYSNEEIRNAVLNYYNSIAMDDGEYKADESECYEDEKGYHLVIRYQKSMDEVNAALARGLLPQANVFVAEVYVDKNQYYLHFGDESTINLFN